MLLVLGHRIIKNAISLLSVIQHIPHTIPKTARNTTGSLLRITYPFWRDDSQNETVGICGSIQYHKMGSTVHTLLEVMYQIRVEEQTHASERFSGRK